jgi:hypothetical protein
MELNLTSSNLALLSTLSAKIPDTVFVGRTRNALFMFKAGFIYVYGRIMRKPRNLLVRTDGKWAETLVYPFSLTPLKDILRAYNVGYTLEMTPNLDLEKALLVKAQAITA